ncbi:MAG: aspartate--tRNA ligase [Myxococcota bacterium]
MARFIDELKRSHHCGELRLDDAGKEVILFGWVDGRRDLGGCIFIDLRDRGGITQVVFDPNEVAEPFAAAERARTEWVIAVRGVVRDRGQKDDGSSLRNKNMATGDIEILAHEMHVFNEARTPPFLIEDDVDTNEEKRLEHRYLDLRRPQLQKNIMRRSRMNGAVRNYLHQEGFLEVETPFLVKYTPGGARNFLVPARLYPGSFYALAESPQLFKQLLMVGGYDKYFQIVRCFRDEALRVDRQPEFTQIDIEMSFINQDDLFTMVEGLIVALWKEALGVDLTTRYAGGKFPRLPFHESMRRFGNDKPDMRFGLEHTDLTELVVQHGGGGVPLLAAIADKFNDGTYRKELPAEIIKAMVVPAAHPMSRKQVDNLEKLTKQMGSKGLARAKVQADGSWTQSAFAKTISDDFRVAINDAVGAGEGDLILMQFGPEAKVQTVMANLRLHLGKQLGLIPEVGTAGKGDASDWNLLWVIDPPLFEPNDDGTWAAAHHVFTRPHDGDVDKITADPGMVHCYRYDIVLNGFEIGGGSIRIHDPAVQAKVFETIGLDEAEGREKFGFLLDALSYGAPPHGGIALGMDRIAMLASETESIRDVIAFPKTIRANDLMTGAPGPVDEKQLQEVHVAAIVPDDS